jgi:septation ring formation regulator EzrA
MLLGQLVLISVSYSDTRRAQFELEKNLKRIEDNYDKMQMRINSLEKDTIILGVELATIKQKVSNTDKNVIFIRDNLIMKNGAK